MKLTKLIFIFAVFLTNILLSNAQTFVKEDNIVNQTNTASNYSGPAWVDIDNDGDLDLHAPTNHIFLNNGDGTFTYDNSLLEGIQSTNSNGVSWADYNNDGYLDVTVSGNLNLFTGHGSSFEKITEGPFDPNNGYQGWAPAWGDYNNDGFVDIMYTHANGFHASRSASFLFINNGDGRFTENSDYLFTQERAPYTIPTWTDYDLDGDLDLFIGSGPANGNPARDYIFINQLNETGTPDLIRLEDGILGTDLQDGQTYNAIDFDNDGDLDIHLTNYGAAVDKFYVNDGGTFTSVQTPFTNGNGRLGGNWGDVDNDGDLDVLVTSESGKAFFVNNGDGTFSSAPEFGLNSGGTARGASFGDYDDDGDLDVFVVGNSEGRGLYKNEISNSNSWIKLQLEGTISNRAAIGAKVKVKATIDGSEVWQIREVLAANSFGGHNSLDVHFGLADASIVDEIIIEWPSSQKTELSNLAVNDTYQVIEEIPAGYLRANFGAEEISGYGEVTVQFEDLSLADPNDPVTSWEWDFDNDGSIDASEQSPSYTYTETGMYSVKLTVTNSSGSQSITRNDYIEVLVEPGIPEILSSTPSVPDTTIDKSGKVDFSVTVEDPTGYELSYQWLKNGIGASSNSTYNYQSSFILPTPRTDTVKVIISNPKNSVSKTWLVNVVNDITGVEDESIPTVFKLEQNYPNPFNPATTINYSLPEAAFVSLKVYDILGNEMTTLVNGEKTSGFYSVNLDAEAFSSGIYFYTIKAGTFKETKKMILLK